MSDSISAAVGRVSQIPPGSTKRVDCAGVAVLLCNVAGRVYAVEDLCSHDGGELDGGELDGCRIQCPRHGALFDVTDGAALSLPAIEPIRSYPVRTVDDEIYIDT